MNGLEEMAERLRVYATIRHLLSSMRVISAIRWQQVRRDFAEASNYSDGILSALSALGCCPPFPEEGKPSGLILIASDEGLVGSFNQQLFARFEEATRGKEIRAIALGAKGEAFLQQEKIPSIAFEKSEKRPSYFHYAELMRLCEGLIGSIERGEIEDILVLFNRFRSFGAYEPTLRRIFPPDLPPGEGKGSELSRFLLLESLTAQLLMAVRQSMASEQSARLNTVSAAEERLKNRIEELNRDYHQAFQERITEELIELTAFDFQP